MTVTGFAPDVTTPASDESGITVYWRPGCMFCTALRRQLDRKRVPHKLVNIHKDPAAAAFVRSVANGNETVPTVSIGSVSLVNPSLDAVLVAATTHAPEAVPAGYEPPTPGRLGRMIGKLLGG
jgi:mycoredoxin